MEKLSVIFEGNILLIKISGKMNFYVVVQPWRYSILYIQYYYLGEILFILVKQ